jgi:hypothetical protein
MVFLARGELPWLLGSQADILTKKLESTADLICGDLPDVFKEIYGYVK